MRDLNIFGLAYLSRWQKKDSKMRRFFSNDWLCTMLWRGGNVRIATTLGERISCTITKVTLAAHRIDPWASISFRRLPVNKPSKDVV
ncbi:MAG: hypothetical protein IPF79_05885 [Ignavibacteria bacterium]|nr:hypothetical protein [Ignavibacteria bacterium]